ncbi:MAG: 6,7-dimethyl-8-ribityllumazine synthase [SAR324 cluster bacterium]|nr:6,7-dimethyl-8-ribityllumazine synthase [SAR324 cluster bacterium]MCZ6749068.1 6,7-dimethyl-8-ribityllumazine synthase [SAR324 cluster bacterium]
MADKEGNLIATGLTFALIVSRFNRFVTDKLMEGAVDAFARHGGNTGDLDVIWVPGAFEMPLAARRLAQSGRYDGLVALGAVIRGATPHFEYLCSAASSGLAGVSVETGVPVGFGLLTTDTMEQAIERAGSKAGNKGGDAMLSAVEMVNLLKAIS